MRPDLPQIIQQLVIHGKSPYIYTNGVKAAKREYVEELKAAGLVGASVSVHTADYHGEPVYKKTLAAIENFSSLGVHLGQISFTTADLNAVLEGVLRLIINIGAAGFVPVHFCVRTPAQIGKKFDGAEYFGSDLLLAVRTISDRNGWSCLVTEQHQNNPYHLGVTLCGLPVQLIHWPTVENIDMQFMNMGPWANFIDGVTGSFALQVILREGMKKGWWQGKRLS